MFLRICPTGKSVPALPHCFQGKPIVPEPTTSRPPAYQLGRILRLGQGLFQIGDDVVDMFDTD